jgi:hypothetical protein
MGNIQNLCGFSARIGSTASLTINEGMIAGTALQMNDPYTYLSDYALTTWTIRARLSRYFFPKKTQPSSHHAAEATATYVPTVLGQKPKGTKPRR